jgi:PfaD family protein
MDRDDSVRWYARGFHGEGVDAQRLLVHVPHVGPGDLGAASFREAHGVRYNYVAGAMAGAIASVELVAAMAEAGLLAFYGAGGVPLEHVETAMETLSTRLGSQHAWGANLLNNPAEPAVEEKTVDTYLKHGVRRISASAYMTLSEAVVRYRLTGISMRADGEVEVPNKVFAKVSRREVATPFLQPAPEAMLAAFVERGILTGEQAVWARTVPVASDLTAEADSGGHTDHRSLPVLLPEMIALRDEMAQTHGYSSAHVPRVGAAGGLGTPSSIWAAFAMGADYVLTGSINQATIEAGTSAQVKEMLAVAESHDVASGPAPDMFEIGAKVQVLSRGSMYAQRAQRLHDLYTTYPSMEALPEKERARVEKQLFKRSLDEVWEGTKAYWSERDPEQVARAEREPRHKMALTFRWYLGMTSRWARMGESDRKRDFQIWCGPSMGGFNRWAKGGALEAPEQRTVVAIAEALMDDAALLSRASAVRAHGMTLPDWLRP